MSVKRRGGRREEHRVRIVSEGTPPTTRVYVGGYLLSGVREVRYSIGVDTWPTVWLRVTDAEIDAIGNLLDEGSKVFVEHGFLSEGASPTPARDRGARCAARNTGLQCVLYLGHEADAPDEPHLSVLDGGFIERWT